MAPHCLPAPSGLSGRSCFREPLPSSLGHSLVLELSSWCHLGGLSVLLPPRSGAGPGRVCRALSPRPLSVLPYRHPCSAEGFFWRVWFLGCRFPGDWRLRVLGSTRFPQQHLQSPHTNGELGGLLLQGACSCIVAAGAGCPHPCPPEQLGTCFPDCAFLVPTRPNLSQAASHEVPGREGHGLGLLFPFPVARAGCPRTPADPAARRAWQSCPPRLLSAGASGTSVGGGARQQMAKEEDSREKLMLLSGATFHLSLASKCWIFVSFHLWEEYIKILVISALKALDGFH